MKKINVLGITLLCGTILTTNVTSALNVNAVQNPTIESTSNESYVAQLQAVIDAAKPYVDYTKYEKGAVDTLKLFIEQAEDDIANGYVSEVTIQSQIDSIQGAVELVKNSPLDTTSSSSTESSTTDTTSSSSTESSTTDTISSSSTESSTTDTTSSSSTEPSTTDTTSSSSSEEIKPTINVSDKTMYVGDKLTEEDILSWPVFENAEGLEVGFEVIGDAIQVLAKDNTLVEAGIHQIRYYIKDVDGNIVTEKIMTLTIKDKGTTTSETTSDSTVSSSSERAKNTSTSTNDPSESKTKVIKSETKVLPKTGEDKSSSLVLLGTITLIAGVYVINLKRKKSGNEI